MIISSALRNMPNAHKSLKIGLPEWSGIVGATQEVQGGKSITFKIPPTCNVSSLGANVSFNGTVFSKNGANVNAKKLRPLGRQQRTALNLRRMKVLRGNKLFQRTVDEEYKATVRKSFERDILTFHGFLLWLGGIFSDMTRRNPNCNSFQLVQAAQRTWKKDLPPSLKERFKQMATNAQLEVGSDEDKESHVSARAAYIQHCTRNKEKSLQKELRMCTEIVVKGGNHN
jgi:hypothetical protein